MEEMLRHVTECLRNEGLVGSIQANMMNENVNASFKTFNSLHDEITTNDRGGLKYVIRFEEGAPPRTLEKGRGAGHVPYNFISILEKWSLDKGLMFLTNRERHNFAYHLNERIKREGTLRHRDNINIYSNEIAAFKTSLINSIKDFTFVANF